MSAAIPPHDEAHEAVRERVQLPAMFLAANGALNLLVGLFAAGYVVREAAMPAEALRGEWVKTLRSLEKGDTGLAGPLKPSLEEAREAEPGRFKRQKIAGDGAMAAVLLTGGVLGVLGGVRMHRARSYSLAVVGSLASLVPCVTPTSCCGLGSLVGLWCACVLLLPGVRAGFR